MDIFLIFAQNIDCSVSNEYPQSMFWSKNKKNRYTPAYPSFTVCKWVIRRYSLYGNVFLIKVEQIQCHILLLFFHEKVDWVNIGPR